MDHIYLTIPDRYDRFPDGPHAPPMYLSHAPYAAHVTVSRGPDNGPATKYLGALARIPPTAWVLFCDDDQELRPDVVERMRRAVAASGVRPAAYQNRLGVFAGMSAHDLIHGFAGVLVPASLLAALPCFPLPPAGRAEDDQWLSLYCRLHGVPILPTGVETFEELFVPGVAASGPAGLRDLANRSSRIRELEVFFGHQIESAEYDYRLEVRCDARGGTACAPLLTRGDCGQIWQQPESVHTCVPVYFPLPTRSCVSVRPRG